MVERIMVGIRAMLKKVIERDLAVASISGQYYIAEVLLNDSGDEAQQKTRAIYHKRINRI